MNKQELIDLVEVTIQHEPETFLSEFPWAKAVVPAKEDKYRGGILNPWWSVYDDNTEILFVRGYVYGDDRWPDGEIVRTSYVVDLFYDEEKQEGVVYTRNTVYQLGERLKV